MRILVAEDDPDLNEVMVKKLSAEGYAVDSCFDGCEALDFLEALTYDAAILDIMMPGLDGLEVVRRLRAAGNLTPVIFLTARDSVGDRVKGLDLGANDYIVKPFSFDELIARIRVVTRVAVQNPTNLYRLADLTLDAETRIVKRAGREISLTAREHALHDGVGMAEEEIPKIWERLYQINRSRSPARGRGLGLGLAMVKQIVELHGGRVNVKSEPGWGTVFTVVLDAPP